MILFSKITVLNFIEEKIFFEGRKVILVPFFFVLPTFLSGLIDVPSWKFISYSFFSSKFAQNKESQIKKLKEFIDNWEGKNNVIFVTHYVVIAEMLNYTPSSGEIIISDKDLKVIDTIEIEY